VPLLVGIRSFFAAEEAADVRDDEVVKSDAACVEASDDDEDFKDEHLCIRAHGTCHQEGEVHDHPHEDGECCECTKDESKSD